MTTTSQAEKIFAAIAPTIRVGQQPGSIAAIAGRTGIPPEITKSTLFWMTEQGWIIRWRDNQTGPWQYALPAEGYQPESSPAQVAHDTLVTAQTPEERRNEMCLEFGSELFRLQSEYRGRPEEGYAAEVNARTDFAIRLEAETGFRLIPAEEQIQAARGLRGVLSRIGRTIGTPVD